MNFSTGIGIRPGILADESLNFARTYGLMPEESWTLKFPYEQWDFSRVYNILEKKG